MLLLAMANGNHLAIDECLSSIAKSSVIPKKNSISEASQEHVEDLENTEASNSDLKEDINDTSELQSNKKTDTKQEKQLREELENLISQYMNKNPEKYCIIVDHNFDLDNIRNLAGQTTENKAQPAVNEEFDIFIATEPDDKNQVTIVGKRLPNTSFAAILDGKKEGIQASQQSL
jgi:hypothetical protein